MVMRPALSISSTVQLLSCVTELVTPAAADSPARALMFDPYDAVSLHEVWTAMADA